MGLATLDKAIEVAINVEASQRVKVQKKDQVYIVDTIEELQREVHNLQMIQAKPRQSKLVTPTELLQRIRTQIISYKGRGSLRGRGCGRERGGFT